MRYAIISLALLGSLNGAFGNPNDGLTPLTSINAATGSPTSESAYATPKPTPDSTIPAPRLPDHLKQFIAKLAVAPGSEYDEELQKRQQGGVGGGVIPPGQVVAQPTQVPTVTAYDIDGQHVIYTQKFIPTPDPWEGPKPGTIGLGTLTGQVGVVKTGTAKPNKLKVRAYNAGVEGSELGGYFRWRW